MNIFKALSQGDGSINETNFTSFLSFIFNKINNFSVSFLILFLEHIEKQSEEIQFQNIIDFSGESYRKKIMSFTDKYTFSAIPEYRLKNNNGKEKGKDIDILINISEKKSETDCCYFLIENKIKKSAFKENQCLEQFLLFKQIENFKDDIPIFSILISPDNKNFKTMIDNVKEENLYSIWLKWQSDNSDSIIDIFKQLIKLENNSEIPPIDINTQFIIKSFIDYVSTELSVGKTTNFSVAGSQIIEQAEFEIKNKRYLLKRFDNKMIRIYNQDNEMINEPVKPILREIIQSYKLDVNLYGKSGKLKNTQILGRDVIRALNNKLE